MDKTIHEHDSVVLLRDLPDQRLIAGDSGVVVYVYDNVPAYEVEFPNPGQSPRYIVVTVEARDVLKLQPASRPKQAVA